MAKKKKPEPPENHERWLVSYADYMTLLFALFVVLYSFAMAKQSETKVMIQGLMESLGQIGLISRPVGSPAFEGGTGILEPQQNVVIDNPDAKQGKNAKAAEVGVQDEAPAANQPINLTIGLSDEGAARDNWPYKTKKDIERKLAGKVKDKEIEIEQYGQQVLIRIGDKPLFPSDSAFLQKQFEPLILEVAKVLAETPGEISIVGHTDSSTVANELYASNWELSVLRATAIVHVMLKEPSLDPARVIAQGVADSRPRVANSSERNRQENRRVEIFLSQGKPTEKKLPLLTPAEGASPPP